MIFSFERFIRCISSKIHYRKKPYNKYVTITFYYEAKKRRDPIFFNWCHERKLDIEKEAHQWYQYFSQQEKMRTESGCIDASRKLKEYGSQILDNLFYQDIYAFPQYGKTKRGTYLEIVKVNPNLGIFNHIGAHILPSLQRLVFIQKIDAIAFVKPTMSRKLQIMNYLEKTLSRFLGLKVVPIKKNVGYFPPQKSLSKREHRIENAKASFHIPRL